MVLKYIYALIIGTCGTMNVLSYMAKELYRCG